MTLDRLTAEYKHHHDALAPGYQSVKGVRIEPYSGRFGKGYKVFSHNPLSTRWVRISYYVKED